jgi:hypothetical protein
VTVTSPTPNQVVCAAPTPLPLNAAAVTVNAGATIVGWAVYDNGNIFWSTLGNKPLSTNLLLSAGSHTLQVQAVDSTGGRGSVTVPLTVNACGTGPSGSGPITNWQVFMHNDGGNLDQAISFDVTQAGSYPFDAYIYYGATCDPDQFTDRFGFGTPLNFGAGSGYMFWFIHRPNARNTSAIWLVGNQSSGCVSYATVPVE